MLKSSKFSMVCNNHASKFGWSTSIMGGVSLHECGVLERNFQDVPLIFGESQIISKAECVSASHPIH